MAKKEDNFDDLDFSAVEEQDGFDDLDFSAVDDEISQLETAGVGAGQGLTMGFLDELYGMMTAEGGASPRQTIQDPESAAEQERKMMESYDKQTEKAREYIKEAKAENPGTAMVSEFVGGIIPAAFTGGGSAMAQTGKALAKGGPSVAKALTGAAKEGAKFGGLYGLGESEAEGLGDMALDTAAGATTGAIAAPALSLGLKGAGKGLKAIKEGASDLAEKFPTLSKPFTFAKEQGMTSSKERAKLMENQAKVLIKEIKDTFESIGLSKELAEQKASQAEATLDLTGDLSLIAKDLRQEASMFTGGASNKLSKLAEQVETLSIGSQTKAAQGLADDVQKEIQKKMDASARKETIAPIKAESKIAKHIAKTGDELETIQQQKLDFEDLQEIPWDTKGGQIDKSRAKFSEELVDEFGQPFKNTYEKQFVDDVTPFQPSKISMTKSGDELIASYINEATGEVFKKYGKLPPSGLDMAKMSVDDLQNWVRAVGKKAFDQNDAESSMYKELWKLGRDKITEILPLLSEKKAGQAKLFQLMEVLGIDKSALNRELSAPDMVKLLKGLPGKMGVEKDYLQRNLLKEGDNISKSLDDIELTADVDKILEGYISHTGEFTKAGLMQKISGLASEGAGSLYGKSERLAKNLTKPITAATDLSSKLLSKMSPEKLNQFRQNLMKQGKGGEHFANEIEKLAASDATGKDKILFSLSQNPAFRKMIGKFLRDMDNQMGQDIGFEEQPINRLLGQDEEEEVGREPDSYKSDRGIDDDLMMELEGFKRDGYVPADRQGKPLGKSGVTIANALDLGQRANLSDLEISDELKTKLEPYLQVKKEEAQQLLQTNPLSLDDQESAELADAVEKAYYHKTESNFNRNNRNNRDFESLPDPVKTVLYSKQFQTGKLGTNVIEAASNDDNYEDVADIYMNSSNGRRKKEGTYLKQKLEELQKNKDREQKQLGSGATPGTERSSLDDLMGSLQALEGVSEEERDEMEEAAMGGDMSKLQELMDQYKGMMS